MSAEANIFSSTIVELAIADIKIPPDRQRLEAVADQALISSIEVKGLINPIIVKRDSQGAPILVAGGRRLDAHKKLNRTTILVRWMEDLNPIAAFLVELQENIARKQLTWQEEVTSIAAYHNMRREAFQGWTYQGTCYDIGISTSWLSVIMTVAEHMDDPEIANCSSCKAALNLLTAKADRAKAAAQSRGLELGEVLALQLENKIPENASKEEITNIFAEMPLDVEAETAEPDKLQAAVASIQNSKLAENLLALQKKSEIITDTIINGDFISWAKEYTGPKFDVLHVDFPYGKNYSGSNTRKTGGATVAPLYDDAPEIFLTLLDALLQHQDNFTFPIAHCMFWFDMKFYSLVLEKFTAAGWTAVQPYPLIWTKSSSGIAADTKRKPRHAYETALLFSRGDRKIVSLQLDHFDCRLDEKLHINQKPFEMLKRFLSLIVDEHTAVLDPTCGSGSALAAAMALKASRILGIELDSSNADVARFILQREVVKTSAPIV